MARARTLSWRFMIVSTERSMQTYFILEDRKYQEQIMFFSSET